MCPGEESTLTEAVPLILTSIRGRNTASAALSALSPLPYVVNIGGFPVCSDSVDQDQDWTTNHSPFP